MMIPAIKPCEKSFEPVMISSGRNIPAVRRITVFQYSAQSLRIMLIANCGNKDSLQAWLFVFSEQIGSTRVFDDVTLDRKSTRLNSSHVEISYAVFCLKKKKKKNK